MNDVRCLVYSIERRENRWLGVSGQLRVHKWLDLTNDPKSISELEIVIDQDLLGNYKLVRIIILLKDWDVGVVMGIEGQWSKGDYKFWVAIKVKGQEIKWFWISSSGIWSCNFRYQMANKH